MCFPAKTLLGTNTRDFLVGPLHSAILFPEKSTAPEPPDPATERATAEAEAAQRANTQLAQANRRRREQNSLMSKGAPTTPPAPTFSLGDSTTLDPGTNTLSAAGATTRNTTARTASLMSRGATAQGVASGGGGSSYQVSMQ